MNDLLDFSAAEEALRQERDLLARATAMSPVSIFVLDRDGQIIFANPRAEQVLGLARNEIIQRAYNAPEWRITDYAGNPLPDEQLPFPQVLRTGRAVYDVRVAIEWPAGRRVLLSINAAPLFGRNGQMDGMIATVEDITERRRVEEELREREQRLVSIYNTVGDVIFQLAVEKDGRYRFTSVNQAFLTITGLASVQVVGKRVDEVIPEPSLILVLEKYREAIQEKKIVRWEETSEYPTGRLIGEVSVAPAFDSAGNCTHLVGAVHDITARVRAEEQLQRTAAELQRSNRDLEKFTYVVSHDLQEPLRTISNFAGLLAELGQGRWGDEADECIHFVLDGANRMEEMVQALLDYSRIGTRNLDLAPADCETVLQRTLADLGFVIAERGVTITHDPLPTVTANAAQLGQLFQNLIVNAIKFHRPEEPPRVHIGAERLSFPPAPSPLREAERGGGEGKERGAAWLFSVRDNGIGIAPRYHEEIFHVFRRLHTREEYSGTGIGLAICARIVERHGGRIWVESEPGQGATFYFTLPAPEEGSP